MNTSKDLCYGIDIGPRAEVVVAEEIDGEARVTGRYRADDSGLSALQQHMGAGVAHRRICIRTGGALALSIGLSLTALPAAEVMFVAPTALQMRGAIAAADGPCTLEQRAERLAVMARRMI